MEVRHRKHISDDSDEQAAKSFPSEWEYQTLTFKNNSTPITTNNENAGSVPPSPASFYTNNSAQIVTYTRDLLAEYLSYTLKYLWQLVSSYWSSTPPSPQLEPHVKINIEKFRTHVKILYDSANPEHETLLLELWGVSFPSETLSNRISAQWKQLGFQGTNPQTDFRGAGIFGLRNLLFLANSYPSRFQQLVHNRAKNRHNEHYPFAITGMNLTMLIFELLGWGFKGDKTDSIVKIKLTKLLFSAQQDSASHEFFSELYCTTFHFFDLQWYEAKATYFDFPKILSQTKIKLEQHLKDLNTSSEIKNYNSSEVAKYE